MIYAHAGSPGGIEIEILLMGLAFFAAAYAYRPSNGGSMKIVAVTAILGIALVVLSVVV